ncbi:RodZ domain-containing protein [Shewanella waksmanii]|uniref:RodZ domain-containing protein n=1 Tax=Shewanella waksmanii TaxID=213783 RepID=UPI00373641EE
MTDKQIDMLEDKDEVADSPTIGEVLAAARSEKSLSIEQVAKSLNLRPGIVKDIEADNFDDMGSTIYVKGYIKNYARLVCADQTLIEQCVTKQFPPVADPAMQSFSRKTSRQARDGRFMLVTYLIVAVLLALLVLWWVQKSNMLSGIDFSKPTVEEVAELNAQTSLQTLPSSAAVMQSAVASNAADLVEQIIEQPQPAADEIQLAAEDNSHQVSTVDGLAGQDSTVVDSTGEDGSAQQYLANASETELPVTSAVMSVGEADTVNTETLSLILDGDCWIQVKDAEGTLLINDLKLAGSEHHVSGQAPFNITLGAPQAVTLKLNDQPINLAQYPSGRVARLTLPDVQ